jgi:SRSO17 transposase
MNATELARCRARLVQYLTDLLAPLGRSDRRHWGEVYIRGLLLEGERKSIEPLAQRLPEGNVQALQQLVGQSPWAEGPVRERLARRLAQELTPGPAWVCDEVGFPKQGQHSVGVARQYCGTLGKVGNCQVAVTLHYTTDDGSFPVDWRLYLPEPWVRDPARCAQADVPPGTRFQTKWELALACCDQARAWGVPDGVVLADSAYGTVTAFREGLEARRLRYVVDVDSTLGVWTTPQTRRPVAYPGRGRRPKPRYVGPPPQALAAVAAQLPRRAWRTIRWREGTQKPLERRFAATRVQPAHRHEQGAAEQPVGWLLIEWPTAAKAPTKYWLSNLPGETPLRRLVRWAKSRWRIEQDYRQLKHELGLDHYEGRGWRGWHHHVTLVSVAHGFLTLETLRRKKNFWMDPAADAAGDPAAPGDVDRDVPHVRAAR